MSDGITDAYRDSEHARLRGLVPSDLAKRAKSLLPMVVEFELTCADLAELGYRVERTNNGQALRVWKEVEL